MSEDPETFLPQIDGYEVYKSITYGANGRIYLGLPSEVAKKARADRAHRSIVIQDIRDQLVVIKIPYDSKAAQEQARREVEVLKVIKEKTKEGQESHKFYHNFAQYIETIEKNGAVDAIVMENVEGINLFNYHLFYQHQERESPSRDLGGLKEPGNKTIKIEESAIPAPIIFHSFVEIGATIEEMHNVLKITHEDLKTVNVMIRDQKPLGMGLPELVLLDYGCASFESDEHAPGALTFEQKKVADHVAFYLLIYTLVASHQACGVKRCINSKHPSECTESKGGCRELYYGCNGKHPKEWAGFVEELERGLQSRRPDFQSFLDKLEPAALDISRDGLKKSDEHKIGVVIDALVQKEMNSEGISNAELGNAIWKK